MKLTELTVRELTDVFRTGEASAEEAIWLSVSAAARSSAETNSISAQAETISARTLLLSGAEAAPTAKFARDATPAPPSANAHSAYKGCADFAFLAEITADSCFLERLGR